MEPSNVNSGNKGRKFKKKFNKKNATTFILVNREGGTGGVELPDNHKASVPKHEFVPVKPQNYRGKWKPKINLDDDGDHRRETRNDDEEELRPGEVGVRVGRFRADDFELGEYGFPDDGYDYSQHFSAMGGGKFFAAAGMGDVTAANREKRTTVVVEAVAAPPPAALDFAAGTALAVKNPHQVVETQLSDADEDAADIDKALEDSQTEDEGWVLQDDFVAVAMTKKADGEEEDDEKSAAKGSEKAGKAKKGVRFADANFDDDDDDSDFENKRGDRDDDDDDDDDDEDGSYEHDEEEDGGEGTFARDRAGRVIRFEERKTNPMLDGLLDRLLDAEYADDDEDYDGFGEDGEHFGGDEERMRELPKISAHEVGGKKLHVNDMNVVFDTYLKDRQIKTLAAFRDGSEISPYEKAKTLELAKQAVEKPEEFERVETVKVDPKWDCESILSTRTNVANHPKQIDDDTLSVRSQQRSVQRAPLKFADYSGEKEDNEKAGAKQKEEADNEADVDEDEEATEGAKPAKKAGNKPVSRKKGESAEEKKARKANIKQQRRKNRAAKKELKMLYSQEATKEKKAAAAATLNAVTVISQ